MLTVFCIECLEKTEIIFFFFCVIINKVRYVDIAGIFSSVLLRHDIGTAVLDFGFYKTYRLLPCY